ncbi:PTS sugar transporter subunit IIA [Pectinatus cerevisiiphilus]|uniref:PTS EIIA type-2 domain-containing protein n=1 Tax=Pectinatus cerevisiiphilus TaxID=86956 RepID=A0A4R3K5U5_9FIRM|nr:PTS sugar transporter subunit IIA [Pectinatus cerevisiiphilus]TCS78149.1 PTS system unknown substrate IIA component (Fru family) [Pectinatus cerevisiiphilus]
MNNIKIKNIFNENLIDLNMNAINKKEAIEVLTEHLYHEGYIINKDIFIKDVYFRENEGQTGLGNHVAIPHGKSDAVKITSIAFGRTQNDLVWESPDNKPVHVVILFAVRNVDKTTVHLKLLSQVAMALADDDTLDKLLVTNSKVEIIELLSQEMNKS